MCMSVCIVCYHVYMYVHLHEKVIILTSKSECKYTLVTYEHTHLPKKWYLYPSMTS